MFFKQNNKKKSKSFCLMTSYKTNKQSKEKKRHQEKDRKREKRRVVKMNEATYTRDLKIFSKKNY